jgi:hypothetical protein
LLGLNITTHIPAGAQFLESPILLSETKVVEVVESPILLTKQKLLKLEVFDRTFVKLS